MKRRGFFAAIAGLLVTARGFAAAAAGLPQFPINRRCQWRFPRTNEALDVASCARAAAGRLPLLTPREKAGGLRHSSEEVKALAIGLFHPMRVAVGPRGQCNEMLFAWHLETMNDGSRRVYLADGGFHSYAPDAFVVILPDEVAA